MIDPTYPPLAMLHGRPHQLLALERVTVVDGELVVTGVWAGVLGVTRAMVTASRIVIPADEVRT